MSFTAAYTELYAIRDGEVQDGSALHTHPRVLDPEGFDSVHERVDIGESTWKKLQVTGEQEVCSEYPTQTWRTVKGFKSWKPTDAFGLAHDPSIEDLISKIRGHEDYRKGPLGYGYNLERIGIPYGGWDGLWRHFFAEVSRHTEPFAFYHSDREHEFPDVTDFRDGSEVVYYVECHDGDLYAEEQTFERTSVEPKIEDAEKVGR